jgi:uncharacterized membrane protein
MPPRLKVLFGLAVVAVAGCTDSPVTSEAPASDRFAVVSPESATHLTVGQEVSIPILLDRGEGFRKEVQVRVRSPKGLQARLSSDVVKVASPGSVNVIVQAYPDTPTGEYVVRFEATPDAARAVLANVRVSVTAPPGEGSTP